MRDPLEGLTSEGLIRTGASRDRIPQRFAAVLDRVVERIGSAAPTASVYVYGSVATGVACSPDSDVDLLVVGHPAGSARQIGEELSAEFVDVCRGVEIATATESDFHGDSDEAYGGRVFLHHYCVLLSGRDVDRSAAGYRGDRRAARGFNGDIDRHLTRWRHDLDAVDPGDLGRRVGRKTLLALAGLVSVHDGIWTTDRASSARRWQQLYPELADGLDELVAWSAGRDAETSQHVAHHLDGTVDTIVRQFARDIGLWDTGTSPSSSRPNRSTR